MKDNPIDQDITQIATPVDAEKHYLPKIIANEIDLMQIKEELRKIHSFSEEDVRISARVISNAHFKHLQNTPGKIQKYMQISVGAVVFGGGIVMILYLWNRGWVSIIPFIIMFAGISIILAANSGVKSQR